MTFRLLTHNSVILLFMLNVLDSVEASDIYVALYPHGDGIIIIT